MYAKATILALAIGLAGCTNAGRLGGGDSAATDAALAPAGVVPGSASDPTSAAFFQSAVGDRVLFSVNEHVLTPQAESVLVQQAAWLQANPDYSVVIEGHADEQGTREYNIALGERRAQSARTFLIAQGVAASRLNTVSFGKERPIEVCSQEACYAQNRRAVTVLTATASGLSG